MIPMVGLIDLVFILVRRHHFIDPEFAHTTIKSFSILGMTPVYAAWTGVLLWASSVFSGLFANWFSFRGLAEAIEHHPRLIYVFGEHRTRFWANYLRKNIAGFAANISLGLLLGMSTPVGNFFGLPLDVRHVTLSTGTMAACCFSLGHEIFSQKEFWLGVGGLLSMAVLNLTVSFALALIVAIWAKEATAPSLSTTLRALLEKVRTKPFVLFLPPVELPKEKALLEPTL